MNSKQSLLYGCTAVVAAPFIVVGGFVYRLGYDIAKFAYTYPKTTAAAIIGSTLLWQQGCSGNAGRENFDVLSQRMATVAERVLEQRDQVASLESELEQTRSQALQWEKQYMDSITPKPSTAPLSSPLETIVQEPLPSVQTAPERVALTKAPPGVLREEGMVFYFVKVGDTLEGISQHVSGWTGYGLAIGSDNGISDPRKMPAGTFLRIREPFYTRAQSDVFSQVPQLRSVRLPGSVRVSEYFGPNANDVLALNNSLGLEYSDAFPYAHGERILYFREDLREEKK